MDKNDPQMFSRNVVVVQDLTSKLKVGKFKLEACGQILHHYCISISANLQFSAELKEILSKGALCSLN